MAEISTPDIQEIIDVLVVALDRLKGTGMPELDVVVADKIADLEEIIA